MNSYKTQDTDLVYSTLVRRAVTEAANGAKRISVRKLLEQTRAELKIEINNDDAPKFARRLVADYPHLDGLIELRALGRRGPNNPVTDGIAASEEKGLRLLALVFVDANGKRYTVSPEAVAKIANTQAKKGK